MPKWITVAFTLFLCLHVFTSQAKTVDEVIDNYVNTIAGKHIRQVSGPDTMQAAAARIKTLHNSPTVYSQGDDDMTHRQFLPRGDVPGTLIDSLQYAEPAGGYGSMLVNYAAKGHRAVLAGKASSHGRACYKVRLILRSGINVDYYIDAASWHLINTCLVMQ